MGENVVNSAAEEAREQARRLRMDYCSRTLVDFITCDCSASRAAVMLETWADLLDPKPRSLRDEVVRAWCAEIYGENSGSALNPADDQLDAADAVLAVIKARIDALPSGGIHGSTPHYRRVVLDLFDGGAS